MSAAPLRPIGTGPFLAAGDAFVWHYRSRTWRSGMPETAFPMRVIRDDERGLVSWLAPGTIGLVSERADGGGLRDDKATMFTAARAEASFQAADWPFDAEWTRWRPPGDWTIPALPQRFPA